MAMLECVQLFKGRCCVWTWPGLTQNTSWWSSTVSVGECMCSTAHHADVSVHLAWSHAKHFVVCLGCDLTDSMVLTLQRMASVQWFGSTRMSGVETQVCGHVQCVEGKVETFLQSWNIALLNHSLHIAW
jgi:hypothetical protein